MLPTNVKEPSFQTLVYNRLEELIPKTKSTSSNHQSLFSPLFIEANKVWVVILKRGFFSTIGNLFLRDYDLHHNLIHNIQCYSILSRFQPNENQINPHSLDTIGIVFYPTTDPDQGTPTAFWQGTLYVVNGLATRLLKNAFSPSPELKVGFDYRYKTLVVRGHEKHVAGEISALDELKNEFDSLLSRMNVSTTPKIEPTIQIQFKETLKELTHVQYLLESTNFDVNKLEHELQKKLKDLFRIAKDVSYLRLFEENQKTNNDIRLKKRHFEEKIKNELKPLTAGYSKSPCTTDQIKALESGLEACKTVVEHLKSRALNLEQDHERKTILQNWDTKIEKFKKIVIEDQVTTAQGPIIRIYQEQPIRNHIKACWHLLSEIGSLRDQSPSEIFLKSSEYRKRLIDFLNEKYQFFKELLKDSPQQDIFYLQICKEDIDKLKEINNFWKNFEAIQKDSLYVSTANPLKQELLKKFDTTIGRKLGSLDYNLLNASNLWLSSKLEKNLDKVFPLILKMIHLSDFKQEVSKLRKTETNRIHYMDPRYAKQRANLDSQLFLVIMTYLQAEICKPGYKNPTNLMKVLSEFASTYVAKERTYGPTEEKPLFTIPAKELSDFLSQPLGHLEQIMDLLNPIQPGLSKDLSSLYSDLDKSSSFMEQIAKNILNHFRAFNQSQEWWAAFHGQVEQQKKVMQNIQDHMTKIFEKLKTISFDLVSFEKNFPKSKETLLESLVRLRIYEPNRSNLVREINSLQQVINKPQAPTKVNRGILKTKDLVETAKNNLLNLEKRMSPQDRLIRDQALEKLDDAEAALIPDPEQELFNRIIGIHKTIQAKYTPTPGLLQKIKAAVEKHPNNEKVLNELKKSKPNQEQLLKELSSMIPTLKKTGDSIKPLCRELELKNAKELMDGMIKDITLNKCVQIREKLGKMSEKLSLSICRREWMSCYDDSTSILSHYFWIGTTINKDPNFSANETHIRFHP